MIIKDDRITMSRNTKYIKKSSNRVILKIKVKTTCAMLNSIADLL